MVPSASTAAAGSAFFRPVSSGRENADAFQKEGIFGSFALLGQPDRVVRFLAARHFQPDVHGLHLETIKREIITALASLGRQIESSIVAEGIEHPAELRSLLSLGVNYGQGYALARTAAARGAEVTLVSANVDLDDPAGTKVERELRSMSGASTPSKA